MSQLKSKLGSLRSEINTLAGLKPIYAYAFDLFRDRGTSHQLMKFDVAARTDCA